MEVLNERVIWQFVEENAFSKSPLQFWVDQTKAAKWINSTDVLKTFKSADHLGNQKWIFDIGGNEFRLAAMVWIHSADLFLIKGSKRAENRNTRTTKSGAVRKLSAFK